MGESELFIALVIAAVMAACMIVIVIVAWFASKIETYRRQGQPQYPTLRPVLQQLADLYDGRLLPGPLYELPRVMFDHQFGPIVLEGQQGGPKPSYQFPYYINIRCPWPDAYFRLDVYPENLLGSLGKLIGMQDIEVGDPKFDRIYMITGNDLVAVRKLLTPRVRELVALVHGPRYDDDIHLRIVGGELSVSKRNIGGDYEALRTFVELSLALYDAALGQPNAGSGIEYIEEGIIRGDAPICQVCGEAIDTPEVQCGRCYTPHHRECWTYFGGCSIYGCRGKYCTPEE